FSLLRGGSRDSPERHRTLHAVVDWSWHLLDEAGQAAMRALSIFPDGFSADAAERLLGDDALPILEHLIDQSLVKTGTRFRFLESDYHRIPLVSEDVSRALSHFRPEPRDVDLARMVATMWTASGFVFAGPRATRSLVALRRLPPVPADTLLHAFATLLAQVPE